MQILRTLVILTLSLTFFACGNSDSDTDKPPPTYENTELGFSVAAKAPLESAWRVQTIEKNDASTNIKSKSWDFQINEFTMGQVLTVEVMGNAEFDIEVGMDGAVNHAVQTVGGTITQLSKNPVDGKSARQYEFASGAKPIGGKGITIAIGPRTVITAVGMYRPPQGDAMKAIAFTDSFKLTK